MLDGGAAVAGSASSRAIGGLVVPQLLLGVATVARVLRTVLGVSTVAAAEGGGRRVELMVLNRPLRWW